MNDCVAGLARLVENNLSWTPANEVRVKQTHGLSVHTDEWRRSFCSHHRFHIPRQSMERSSCTKAAEKTNK
jgi:hypothetical protein